MVAVPPLTVSVPLVTASVTVMLEPPASTSLMDRPVIALAVSSAVVCATGTVLMGASLTAVTFIVMLLGVASKSVPSFTENVKLA